jgi:hypothetical protein
MGAIRLFLALAVLYSHIVSHFLAPSRLFAFGNELVLGMNGGYAVMFFFVVSGFLISFVLETKYNHSGGTAEFYRARALRIYPLWWALYLVFISSLRNRQSSAREPPCRWLIEKHLSLPLHSQNSHSITHNAISLCPIPRPHFQNPKRGFLDIFNKRKT